MVGDLDLAVGDRRSGPARRPRPRTAGRSGTAGPRRTSWSAGASASPTTTAYPSVFAGVPLASTASPVESPRLIANAVRPPIRSSTATTRAHDQELAAALGALLLAQGSGRALSRGRWSVVRHGRTSRVRGSGGGRAGSRGRSGCAAARPATADSSSRPTSRAISHGYFAVASASKPPPPKQPQSIWRPRAQAEAMPMMKATNSSAETMAVDPGEHAERSGRARPRSRRRAARDRRSARWPRGAGRRRGPRARSRRRVGTLSGTGHEPHPADHQSREGAEPLLHPALHTPQPRRRR